MLRGFGVRGRGRVRRLLQLQWGPGAAAVTAIRQLNCPRPWKEPGFWELPPAGLGCMDPRSACIHVRCIYTYMHASKLASAAAGRRSGGGGIRRIEERGGIWRPRPDPSAHACVSCGARRRFCSAIGCMAPTLVMTMRGCGRGRSDGFEVSAAGAGDASLFVLAPTACTQSRHRTAASSGTRSALARGAATAAPVKRVTGGVHEHAAVAAGAPPLPPPPPTPPGGPPGRVRARAAPPPWILEPRARARGDAGKCGGAGAPHEIHVAFSVDVDAAAAGWVENIYIRGWSTQRLRLDISVSLQRPRPEQRGRLQMPWILHDAAAAGSFAAGL